MERCHIQTIDGPDRVTVRIAGEVDLACAKDLVGVLALALATERPVVVDSALITFLDSTGLKAFAEARILAHKRRVGFQLAAVSEPVRRVLELSGTTSLFDIAAEPVEPPALDESRPGVGQENVGSSADTFVNAGNAGFPATAVVASP